MSVNLLAGLSTPVWIAIGGVGALVLASIVYGVFRNFVRMAWTSWQILAIFALTLLLKFIPVPDGMVGFAVGAGYLFGATALVLVIGFAVRRYMMGKKTSSNAFFRVMNRVLGAVTSVLNFVMLAAVLGGFGLAVSSAFVQLEVLDHPVWAQYCNYLADLMLVSLCLFFVRGGFRIGLARSIQTTIMLVLTFGALFLAMYMTVEIGFMRGWVNSIGSAIAGKGLNIIIATLISYFIIVAACFLIFFAVIIVFGYFLNKLTRKFRSIPGIGYIDGIILSVVFFAVFIALTCGWNYVVSMLVSGDFSKILGSSVTVTVSPDFAIVLENLYTASPLSKILYELNLLNLFLG